MRVHLVLMDICWPVNSVLKCLRVKTFQLAKRDVIRRFRTYVCMCVYKSGTRQKINDVIFSLTSAISHEMEPYVEDVCVGAATTSSIFFFEMDRRVNTYRQFNENEMDPQNRSLF